MCATEGVGGSGTGPFCITHLFCSIYCSSLTFGIVVLVSIVPSWHHHHCCPPGQHHGQCHQCHAVLAPSGHHACRTVVGWGYCCCWHHSHLSHLSVLLQFIPCVHCTMPSCKQWWQVLGHAIPGPLVEVRSKSVLCTLQVPS